MKNFSWKKTIWFGVCVVVVLTAFGHIGFNNPSNNICRNQAVVDLLNKNMSIVPYTPTVDVATIGSLNDSVQKDVVHCTATVKFLAELAPIVIRYTVTLYSDYRFTLTMD